MTNVAAIFRRELAGYFGHPLAYIVLTVFLLSVAGFSLGAQDILTSGVATMRVPFFWVSALFLFLIPAITMRSVAEELRTGSIELMGTLPVRPGELIVGKWLATLAVIVIALLLTLSYPLALSRFGDLDWGPVVGGYLGLLFMGSAFAAIGLATSALTDNQVVAFVLALGACAIPWVVGLFLHRVPADLVPIVQYLTIDYHFANLARGVLDTRSVVFFVTVAAVGLRLATLILEHRRLS